MGSARNLIIIVVISFPALFDSASAGDENNENFAIGLGSGFVWYDTQFYSDIAPSIPALSVELQKGRLGISAYASYGFSPQDFGSADHNINSAVVSVPITFNFYKRYPFQTGLGVKIQSYNLTGGYYSSYIHTLSLLGSLAIELPGGNGYNITGASIGFGPYSDEYSLGMSGIVSDISYSDRLVVFLNERWGINIDAIYSRILSTPDSYRGG